MVALPRSAVRYLRVVTTACAVCTFIAALGVPAAANAQAQMPQRPSGSDPGSLGPCLLVGENLPNQAWPARQQPRDAIGRKVAVLEPYGSGSPRTGGTCSDGHRPVVFIAHGLAFCINDPANPGFGYDSQWQFYSDLVQRLVSQGYIVVYPNYCMDDRAATMIQNLTGPGGGGTYAMVWSGIEQATNPASTPAASRMDLSRVGFWGHSFGGGMAPWLAEQAWTVHGWGSQAFWLATYAPYLKLAGPTISNYNLPPQTASLHVIYQHDQVCSQLTDSLKPFIGTPLAELVSGSICNVKVWSRVHYTYSPAYSKWRVRVNSDCSHGGTCPPTDERQLADHYTCANKDFNDGQRAAGYLKYFSTDRNLDALYDCALAHDASSASCVRSLLPAKQRLSYMGEWSDTVPATPATICTETCPP